MLYKGISNNQPKLDWQLSRYKRDTELTTLCYVYETQVMFLLIYWMIKRTCNIEQIWIWQVLKTVHSC